MDQGLIVEKGSPQSLLKKHFPASKITLRLSESVRDDEVIQRLKSKLTGFMLVDQGDHGVRFFCEDQKQLFAELLAMGVAPSSLAVEKATLEDIFLKLTGRELRS